MNLAAESSLCSTLHHLLTLDPLPKAKTIGGPRNVYFLFCLDDLPSTSTYVVSTVIVALYSVAATSSGVTFFFTFVVFVFYATKVCLESTNLSSSPLNRRSEDGLSEDDVSNLSASGRSVLPEKAYFEHVVVEEDQKIVMLLERCDTFQKVVTRQNAEIRMLTDIVTGQVDYVHQMSREVITKGDAAEEDEEVLEFDEEINEQMEGDYPACSLEICEMDSILKPLELADFLSRHRDIIGTPAELQKDKPLNSQLQAYFGEARFISPYNEEELAEECLELLKVHEDELGRLSDDGTRYSRAFHLLRKYYLVVQMEESPTPSYSAKKEFLDTWNDLLAQIPSKDEVRANNPDWDEYKVQLFEELKNPERLFELTKDEEALRKAFSVLAENAMGDIAEEPEESEDEGLEADFP
ncbi:hypothetical protein QR680_009870 [Steinernema hermaphroditum]|uniref:Uncharacterized protein n=1 Tax=Steinernema hermaphroditum TaxID=289476 RepID=A0AA39MA80_9BILA|nr:hypothetical protein QR680_009870 [Steinernema hermaphroditum]